FHHAVRTPVSPPGRITIELRSPAPGQICARRTDRPSIINRPIGVSASPRRPRPEATGVPSSSVTKTSIAEGNACPMIDSRASRRPRANGSPVEPPSVERMSQTWMLTPNAVPGSTGRQTASEPELAGAGKDAVRVGGGAAVRVVLEVQVRPVTASGAPDPPEELPGRKVLADGNVAGLHMRVEPLVPHRVADDRADADPAAVRCRGDSGREYGHRRDCVVGLDVVPGVGAARPGRAEVVRHVVGAGDRTDEPIRRPRQTTGTPAAQRD